MLSHHGLVRSALVLLFIFAPLSVNAQTVNIDRIQIFEWGIYQAETTQKTSAPGTASGQLNTITNIQNIEQTTTIPARMGLRFGFRFNVIGAPQGATAQVRMVTIFPKPGLYNPDRQLTFDHNEYMSEKTIGRDSYAGWRFEHPYELVPGVWTWQIWYQGQKLGEQSFTVVKP